MRLLEAYGKPKDILIVEGDLFRFLSCIIHYFKTLSLFPNSAHPTMPIQKIQDILETIKTLRKEKLILLIARTYAKVLGFQFPEKGYQQSIIGHIDSNMEWYSNGASYKEITTINIR
ncbi:GT-D fold domain-containing glycosyltransferase [Lactococcus cremoris]|uniref:GT-D fold domain-containing glycosyltransferase n=1 Tax=Lactococcus lactis subsp. cremoris TaxID=1359 RepID=UPI000583332E|nr:hypothetical protein JL36_02540 [Lactococcus cremoris]